jgi:hypothetical protein
MKNEYRKPSRTIGYGERHGLFLSPGRLGLTGQEKGHDLGTEFFAEKVLDA